MSKQLREAVEQKKQQYIEMLLEAGVYRVTDRHLYNLTLSELEMILKLAKPR